MKPCAFCGTETVSQLVILVGESLETAEKTIVPTCKDCFGKIQSGAIILDIDVSPTVAPGEAVVVPFTPLSDGGKVVLH